jgi:hypothetical protein
MKFLPYYKHLLQENCVEKKTYFLTLLKLVYKISCHVFVVMLQFHVCIPRSFLVINVCNQEKALCSPCRNLNNVETMARVEPYSHKKKK